MPTIQEYLNGGVVQTRHPLLLQPGEVQAAENCILKPGDPALHKVAGREVWATTVGTTINGCTVNGTTLTGNTFCVTFTATTNVIEGDANIIDSGGWGSTAVGDTVYITNGTADTRVLRVNGTTLELSKPIPAALDGTMPSVRISSLHKDIYVTSTTADISIGTKVVSVESATSLTLDTSQTTQASPFTCLFANAVTGLAPLTFDVGRDDVMLAKSGHTIYQSALTNSASGTFSSLKSGLTHDDESYLQSITSRKKHVILTGQDAPLMVYYRDDGAGTLGLTSRAVGMLPVSDGAFRGPSILEGGNWPDADNGGGEGYYNFLITEVLKQDGDEIEGTYEGDPKQVHLADPTSQGITVTYMQAGDTPANDGLYGRNSATHWRIYMAPVEPKSLTDPQYSAYTRITDVPIGDNSINLVNDSIFRVGYCRTVVATTLNGNEETFFPNGEAGFISAADGFLAAENAVQTLDNNIITTTNNAFANCVIGMEVFSPSDNLASGTIVTDDTDDNTIVVSSPPIATKSNEALSFGNASSIGDGTTATCYPNTTRAKYKAMQCSNFDFGTTIGGFAGATITGIKVELFARNNETRPHSSVFTIHVWKGGEAGESGRVIKAFLDDRQRTKMVVGGKTDGWDLTWESTDFLDGNLTTPDKFMVRITKQKWDNLELEAIEEFDGMKVTVYAGFNTIHGQGDAFDTITVKDAVGNDTVLQARFPPPIASTGDVFNGILVLNDISEENIVAGSRPDDHEAFPSLYRIPIESKDNDKVTLIRRLGNILIIGMENSIKRMNYFPLETDPDFTRGRAYEDVATDHGIVGPRAATLLDLPGRGVVLAYLSAKGLFWTDGITTTPLNIDIDWDALFQYSLIHRSVLTVYPRKQQLVLSYVPSGAAYKTKALYFSYNPSHLKQKMYLPATGPIDMVAESSAGHLIGGKSFLYSGHSYNGIVYEEDKNVTDEGGGSPIPLITTRQYLTGRSMGDEGRLRHVHLLLDANGDNATEGAFTGTTKVQNEGAAKAAQDTFSGDSQVGGVTQIWSEVFGDSFDITLTQLSTSVAFTVNYFGFDFAGYGESSL